jgi:hypothetical protein
MGVGSTAKPVGPAMRDWLVNVNLGPIIGGLVTVFFVLGAIKVLFFDKGDR